MNAELIKARELFDQILQTSNLFLRNIRLFDVQVLKTHDPSYEELAEIMEVLAHIIYSLSDDFDPMLAQKANDYVYLMKGMAIAIRNEDNVTLSELTEQLEKKPGC